MIAKSKIKCNTKCNAISNAYLARFLQYYYMRRVDNRAFQLKTNRKETENKTIRFPVQLIEQIDQVIGNQDVTFSSFVIQACEYALENMDVDAGQKK